VTVRRKEKTEPGNDLEGVEIELFLLGLLRRYGYDLRGYAPAALRAHILRRVREEELESVSRLSEQILRRPEILHRFLSQLSDSDGALFSPADFWRSLRKNVVPFLRTYPTVRCWLVGGDPESLYSLSIVLDEDLPRKVQIFATGIHESLLDPARKGALPSEKVREGAKGYRRSGGRESLDRYFESKNGSATFSAPLRRKVVFASHNPVTDGTFQQCHVVLARNSLRLYSEDLRKRTLDLLHQSLIPLGFLALGPGESMGDTPLGSCYQEVDGAVRLFQKVRE